MLARSGDWAFTVRMMPDRRTLLKASAAAIVFPALPGLTQSPREKIKIAQIGTGHPHASGKMSVFRHSPDFEVVGVAEPDPGMRSRAKKSSVYGDLPFLSVDRLLNAPGLKAVAIETEPKNLLHYAEKAIDAGLHIHVDKPAGQNFPHFQRIAGKAVAKGLTIQLGYMYRYNPAIMLMRDFLKKGWLGEPFEVQTTMSKVLSSQNRQWVADYPGGIMFELGCHVVDLVIGVLGAPDKVNAYPRHSLTRADDTLLDNMLAVFEYPRATATVRSTGLEVEGFARRHFTVAGTEGTCHIQPLDRPTMKVAFSNTRGEYKKGYQTIEFQPPYQRYVGDVADFAKIIRGEKKSDFPIEHELMVQRSVLLACGLPLE